MSRFTSNAFLSAAALVAAAIVSSASAVSLDYIGDRQPSGALSKLNDFRSEGYSGPKDGGPASLGTTTLGFEDLAVNATLGSQYLGLGVDFQANAFAGTGWATNTDMTVVSSTGGDVGGLGAPALVSGNIIRSFNGWLAEDGDPSAVAIFSIPDVHSVSVTFAGSAAGSGALPSELVAYDSGFNLLDDQLLTTSGQGVLTVNSATDIAYVAILPGEFNDWVGWDNFSFTTSVVPEPTSLSLLGLAGVALIRRRRI